MLSDKAAIRAAHIILASGSPRRVQIFNELLQLDVRLRTHVLSTSTTKGADTPSGLKSC